MSDTHTEVVEGAVDHDERTVDDKQPGRLRHLPAACITSAQQARSVA